MYVCMYVCIYIYTYARGSIHAGTISIVRISMPRDDGGAWRLAEEESGEDEILQASLAGWVQISGKGAYASMGTPRHGDPRM